MDPGVVHGARARQWACERRATAAGWRVTAADCAPATFTDSLGDAGFI